MESIGGNVDKDCLVVMVKGRLSYYRKLSDAGVSRKTFLQMRVPASCPKHD